MVFLRFAGQRRSILQMVGATGARLNRLQTCYWLSWKPITQGVCRFLPQMLREPPDNAPEGDSTLRRYVIKDSFVLTTVEIRLMTLLCHHKTTSERGRCPMRRTVSICRIAVRFCSFLEAALRLLHRKSLLYLLAYR
jgi:hypothetical protein